VSIDIMRKQKRVTLTWKVPESSERRVRRELERKERQEESSLRERLGDLQRLLQEKQVEMRRLLQRAPHLQRV
jgi:phage-related minor tail protein